MGIRKLTIVSASNLKFLLNDRTYQTDENGVLCVDIDELLVSEDRGLAEFDREVETMITEPQKQLFYEMVLECNRFGMQEVRSLLGVEKNRGVEVVMCAFRHKLIRKHDSQWKIDPVTRDEIRQYLLLQKRKALITEKPDMFDYEPLPEIETDVKEVPTTIQTAKTPQLKKVKKG